MELIHNVRTAGSADDMFDIDTTEHKNTCDIKALQMTLQELHNFQYKCYWVFGKSLDKSHFSINETITHLSISLANKRSCVRSKNGVLMIRCSGILYFS